MISPLEYSLNGLNLTLQGVDNIVGAGEGEGASSWLLHFSCLPIQNDIHIETILVSPLSQNVGISSLQ